MLTEFLSVFHYLTNISIFFSYVIFTIVCFYFSQKFKLKRLSFSTPDKYLFVAISFMLLITLVTALISPPNNWDSMTYHMSRVEYWIQNKGIHFFTTNNPRQNVLAPFSEFLILHFQILSGSDIFANLVQWISLIINLTTVSLICKEFGLNQRLQLISAVFICSLPIVLLQASSTQNDIVASTFVLLFYYYQIILVKKCSILSICFSGLALGLGILTKGTSYILLFATGITYLAYLVFFKIWDMKNIIFRYGIIFLIGLLINFPHYLRNLFKYNDFLGLGTLPSVINEFFSFGVMFSNLIRHIAYQLGTNINIINWYIYRIVEIFLGNNISDPKTSFLNRDFRPPFFSLHEDSAGNFIHTLAIIFIFFTSLAFIKQIKRIQLTSLLITVISILLYCFLLKWQPWTGKVLPLFVIATPFLMVALNYIIRIKELKITFYIILFIMLIGTFPYLFYNKSRPLLAYNNKSILYQDRFEGYFNNRPNFYKQYIKIINRLDKTEISKKDSIALHLGGDSWDYPFLVMLKKKFNNKPPYIFQLKKEDIERIGNVNFSPTYIIFENQFKNNLELADMHYQVKESSSDFTLLKKINQ